MLSDSQRQCLPPAIFSARPGIAQPARPLASTIQTRRARLSRRPRPHRALLHRQIPRLRTALSSARFRPAIGSLRTVFQRINLVRRRPRRRRGRVVRKQERRGGKLLRNLRRRKRKHWLLKRSQLLPEMVRRILVTSNSRRDRLRRASFLRFAGWASSRAESSVRRSLGLVSRHFNVPKENYLVVRYSI